MFDTRSIIIAINYFARLLNLFILIRVIFSWIRINPYSPLGQFIYGVTEPILNPIRSMIQNVFKYHGMIDFSPILAIILINMVSNFVIGLFLR